MKMEFPPPSDNRSCVFSFHQVQYVVSFYKEGLYMIVQDTMQYLSQLDPEVGASSVVCAALAATPEPGQKPLWLWVIRSPR